MNEDKALLNKSIRLGGLSYPRTLVEEWQRAVRAVIGLNISDDVEVEPPWAMQIVSKLLTSLDMALTAALREPE